MKPMKMLLALGLSGMVLGAVAQTSALETKAPTSEAKPCMDGGGYHGQMKGMRGEHSTQRLKELHDKLKLNADQEKSWQAMGATMQPPADRKAPDMAEMEKLTAPERMEKRMAFMKEHQDAMATRLAATKTFYAKLNPEQKKTFDQETLPREGRRGHGQRPGGKPEAKPVAPAPAK